MSDSPFVGPRPFEKEDSDRFFGRTRETEELLSLIIAHRAVLVYAQSGAGKSSLLRAGVINRLEEQQYQILRPARVHGLLPTDVPPESVHNIFVYHALQYWAATLPSDQTIKDHAKTTLSEFFRFVATSTEAGEEGSPSLIVIFDQFEEFFTTNAHRWQERGPFFDQVVQALHDLPTMKIVFVMREEYIAQLEPFAELLPEKLRPRMHLERLRGNSARNAVVKPFQKWTISFDPAAADKLMGELLEIRVAEGDKFREIHGEFVEPVQLQVVCQSLWENLPAEWKNGPNVSSNSPRLITAEYIERFGDVNNALALYYDRSVEKAAAASEGRIGEGELRRWFGTALITPTGTRGLAFRGAPGATWRIPGLALKELEEAHVIRREDRSGTITHELTHDRFIEPIQKSNEVWLARYQEAERIRAKLEEYAKRESDELLDELDVREAEEYLNSPAAKILGASPDARQLVRRSRNELEETKRRRAEELEEARQRAEEQERLRKAESERVKLLLEKRKRDRIFGVIVFVLGMIILMVGGALYHLQKERVRELERSGKAYREKAEAVGRNSPTKDVTALRNLAIALRYNPNDTIAAPRAAKLLMEKVWCPPLSLDLTYEKDAILAATFSNDTEDEVFALSGDGNLLRSREGNSQLETIQQLFGESRATTAVFSSDARWLFVLLPTVVSSQNAYGSADEQAQSTAPPPPAGREKVKVRVWRWSTEARRYTAGPERDLSLMSSSRTTLTWNERAQDLLLINARSDQPPESHLFHVTSEGVAELTDTSAELSRRKVVAAGVSPDGERLAIGSSNGVVALLSAVDYQPVSEGVEGKDLFHAPNGFPIIAVNFGPGEHELALSSWTGLRTLNMASGERIAFESPTFRDQFIRRVLGPGNPSQRLIATALYGRVQIARAETAPSANIGATAEPIVVRGSIAIPQFSRSGRRVLTLSGGTLNADTLRVSDVTMLNEPQPTSLPSLENTSPPTWLWELAAAVSALDASDDGSLRMLENIRSKYKPRKAAGSYESVWKRFFPDERGTP
ncbi:MAG TPA: hypothetical protein VGM65_09240 [Candidatus Udaeobacter sp.]|jgi:hypothetical protein